MFIFTEIAIVVVVAVFAGFIAHLLRQPVIIGFLSAGLIIGLFEHIELSNLGLLGDLSSIGIALLLFLVGLEMNLKELKHITGSALLAGLGQITFTFGSGYLIASVLGFTTITALYIGIALTFSSTIVIVKLLSEKKDLTSLYGRVSLGILLVQDFVAILFLIFIPGLSGDSGILLNIISTLFKGGILVVFILLASKILPKILDYIGKSQEMLYLFGLAWALGISALSGAAGLSFEVGGFLAGLALASSSAHFQIGARLRPLRDFFIILFFVSLGAQAFGGGGSIQILPAIIFSLFVLIGNPLISMILMGTLGYRSRTSFLTSISIAQISEFSLIIVTLGFSAGHIDNEIVSLITLVGVFTIFVSSYFIVYGNSLYRIFRPFAEHFEFRKKLIEELPPEVEYSNHVILIGAHHMGESILRSLSSSGVEFIAVDFNPDIVRAIKESGEPVVYGDIADPEIQDRIGLSRARVVISTIPTFNDNLGILKMLKKDNDESRVVVTAENEWEAKELYHEGADYVLTPHITGGRELADAFRMDVDLSHLSDMRERDQKILGYLK